MLIWRHHMFSAEKAAFAIRGPRVTAGRNLSCDIKLPSAFVADRALVFELRRDGWIVEATGGNGCEYAGQPLRTGTRVVLQDGAELRLYPFVLKIELTRQSAPSDMELDRQFDEQVAKWIRTIHRRLLDTFGCTETDEARELGAEYLLRLEHAVEELAGELGLLGTEHERQLRHLAGQAVRSVLIDRVIGTTASDDPLSSRQRKWVRLVSAVEERESDLATLVERIEQRLQLDHNQSMQERMTSIDQNFVGCWRDHVRLLPEFYRYLAFRELKKQIKDILFGYGAIEDLLRLPTVSEIMVVGHDQIFIEKKNGSGGTIENSGRRFVSPAATQAVIERIVSRCNRRIDQSQPLVDARLDDGSRVNAVIPPIAVCGPCLTIRKFPQRRFRIANWFESGLTQMAAEFLESAVRGRRNFLVVGGTGAGKTTLLNCLADWIPERERIVTIEDTAELQLQHDHVVQLQTRPANADERGAVTARDLVRNALRMRPDRIIIGECRGAEALDMLNALNTGHDGSMTTLHANSPHECPIRIESLVKVAVDFSEAAIRQQIASAFDLIVQVTHGLHERSGTKQRYVSAIAEVRGVDDETGRVEVVDLFSALPTTQGWTLRPTGRLPSFGSELVEQGLFDLKAFCPTEGQGG